jgi:EAL domain-containing protein (putative c-di-GMP-specific phosphodiesterase class I)
MLKLEITESLLMDNVEEAIKTMKAIRALGVHLAIDDFGTGYSSLSYLKRFPINQVKIDHSFVRDLGRNASDTAIVHAVISLARSLELEVIAEGVEEESQGVYLAEHGCETAQGYHLGRPMPASMLGLLLQSCSMADAGPRAEEVVG